MDSKYDYHIYMKVSEKQKKRIERLVLERLGKQPVHDSIMRKVVKTTVDVMVEEHSKRLRSAKAAMRCEGRFLGGAKAPFGWKLDANGKLRECPQEQAWIRRAREMHGDEKNPVSLRDIASAIQNAGHKISHTTVANMLRAKTLRSIG